MKKLFLLFFMLTISVGIFAQTTVGPNTADVGTSVTGVGTVAWTNAVNALANDNSYATVALNNSTSNYLQTTDYDFAIPTDKIILGIQVTIGRFGTTGSGEDIQDNIVSLIKAGSVVGDNNGATATDWPSGEATANYGGTSDLWGTTWTPAEVNAIDFGVALSVNSSNSRTASVDYMQITITYTNPINTWDGSSSTAWGTPDNWSLSHVPLSGEDIVIPDNVTGSNDNPIVDVAAVCANLTLSGGGSSTTLTISGSNSLTVSGSVTIGAGTSSDIKTIAVGDGSLNCASLSITDVSGGGNNSDGVLSILTGTVTVSGNVTMSGSSSENFINFSGAGTLNIGGSISGGTISASTGTVNYNGSSAQAIGDYAYYNLTTSGSDTKTMQAATTVNGNVTIGSGTTLDEADITMTLSSGSIVNVNGTLDFSSSTGLIRTGNNVPATLTMGSTGLIKTMDQSGLGPAANASFQNQGTGTWTSTSLSTNGTIEYYRTSAQTVTDRDYNNLIITNTGTKTWTLGATRTVNGNITVSTSAPFTLSGSQTINLKGNWSNSGSFTAGTSTINMNGSNPQTMSGSIFNNLTINSAGVTLLTDETVSGTLTMTSGNIALNSNTLTLGTGETVALRGTLSWTDGFMTGAGTFKRYFSENATVTLGDAQGLFPMGNGSDNRSVWIGCSVGNNVGGTISVLHSNATGFSAISPTFDDGGVTVDRRHNMNWTLSIADGFQDDNAELRIQGTGIPGVSVEANLRMVLSNTIVSGTTNADGGGSFSNPIVERSGFSHTELAQVFYFGCNSAENPLPVELTSFSASVKNYTVHLNWETSTESRNYGFDVERSADKINWSKVAFVNGHGNSNSTKQYSYTDSKISSGKYYYRLKQIDIEGSFAYSKEIEVSTGQLLKDFVVEQNFPNPFNPSTTIKFGFKESVSAKVIIYNALGSLVTTLFNERAEAGKIYSIDFDGSQLASGIYFYAITGGKFKSVKKMILTK